MSKPLSLSGLIAAPFTAFDAHGALNLKMIAKQAESFIANKITGAFICGTTGEGLSLTLQERQQVLEAWAKAAKGKLRLIVHVGHHSLEDCRTLSRHAHKLGADAISVCAPSFYKPATIDDLVTYCAAVAESAPKIPFYFYHIPSMTNAHFAMADFLEAAQGRIPTLAGVKFTHENLMDLMACLQLKNFEMIYGRDEALLAGLATGCRAAIGATYNFAAPIYHRLIAAFERSDLKSAREEQARSVALIRLLYGYGFMAAAKATMGMIGLEMGPLRLPLRALTDDKRKKLASDLKKLGFFDWIK